MLRLAAGCLLIILIFGCRFEPQSSKQDMVVCITFDDNCESVFNHALPIMRQYGYRGTVFTNSGSVGQTSKLTWAQIDSLRQTYHWEIGGHTLNHTFLSDVSPQQAEFEIAADYNNLKQHSITPRSFATPYGICPVSYYPIITKYYRNVRTIINTPMQNPIDRTLLGSFGVLYNMSPDEVINRVTQGIADEENLVIFMFHEIETTESYYAYYYKPESFRELMAKLHNMGVKVLPLDEAIEYLED
jgi:peptidoglycan/xylan/chitin deacetylase (PgdA/CDA1 family)